MPSVPIYRNPKVFMVREIASLPLLIGIKIIELPLFYIHARRFKTKGMRPIVTYILLNLISFTYMFHPTVDHFPTMVFIGTVHKTRSTIDVGDEIINGFFWNYLFHWTVRQLRQVLVVD